MANDFMGLDGFVWFTGVVEDRNDPAKLGRVRVRCLGFHTEDKNDIPTTDLPWAHVMHPVTDPSMQGMGNTPTFLLEGSWVVGFFRDAQEKQQPIIMGSLPGVPSSTADSSKGFNDPNATYPNSAIPQSGHSTGESDTSRLARGGEDAETHQSLIDRRAGRIAVESTGEGLARSSTGGVPIATKPNFGADGVSTVLVSEDERTYWSEPNPQGVPTSASQYPSNHVFESESGHISEVDDTPGAERLHREHRTGTFEEIHPDGSRVTKVVKDDYEIVYGDKSVFIAGNVNLTISGNVRHLIQGDYVQEVEGDYTLKVGKNMYTKIGALGVGNYELDILGGHSYRVADDYKGVVGIGDSSKSNYDIQIKGSESRQVGGASRTSVVENASYISDQSLIMLGKKNVSISQTSSEPGDIIKIDARGAMVTRITGTVREKYNSTLNTQITGAVTESFVGGQTTTITGDQTTTTTGVINLN
jgi:hypothetical protein